MWMSYHSPSSPEKLPVEQIGRLDHVPIKVVPPQTTSNDPEAKKRPGEHDKDEDELNAKGAVPVKEPTLVPVGAVQVMAEVQVHASTCLRTEH